jgi:hypothetical protein
MGHFNNEHTVATRPFVLKKGAFSYKIYQNQRFIDTDENKFFCTCLLQTIVIMAVPVIFCNSPGCTLRTS